MDYKVIDMHCDTITAMSFGGKNRRLRDNDMQISLNKMKKGNYMCQCFALCIPEKFVPDCYAATKQYIQVFKKEMAENADMIVQAFSADDIEKAGAEGKMAGMLTIEDGVIIAEDLSRLDYLYEQGVRMITLTWNFENSIGYPNNMMSEVRSANTTNGLKEFGIETVRRMNELGIIVDVSHLSDKGFYDVIEHSTKPIVASHSNARSLCSCVRNLTDDMLVKLAENGGITGINYYPEFISDDKDVDYLKKTIEHIRHIVEIAGIDHVGLGSDFDGYEDPKGMMDCTSTELLYNGLLEAGFSSDDIDKIFYKNFLRVLRANEK